MVKNITCLCYHRNKIVTCFITMIVIIPVIAVLCLLTSRAAVIRPEKEEVSPLKLIIDTDAGVDDAVAISLALGVERHSPNSTKILAITCVTGNTIADNVVLNVFKVLKTADRLDIPVYKGAEKAILVTPESDYFFGTDGFNDIDFPDIPDPNIYLKKEHAVTGLIDIVKNNPGEVTIVCLGPLTNIALAIRLEPNFLNYTKQLVVLGGAVEGRGNVKPGLEFNFYFDPEADFIVLSSSAVKPVILMPLETFTYRHNISKAWRRDVLGSANSPIVDLLNKAEEKFFNDSSQIWTLTADPFAMAVALNEDLITLQTEHVVRVDTNGNRGLTIVDYNDDLNEQANVDIVINIDVEGFKNYLVDNLP